MSSSKITAFHGIFEERLKKLVKHIKKIRKDPTAKDKVNQLLVEANGLKKLIKKDKNDTKNTKNTKDVSDTNEIACEVISHTIEIAYEIIDGKLVIKDVSSPSFVGDIEVRSAGGLLVIDFDVHPKG